MPKLPKSKPRPWVTKKKPKQFRQVDNSKFYNSKQWRATRNFYIQSNPICEQCDRNGILTGGQCVDHITPLSKGGTNDHSNLQTLCNPCHAKKSSREGIEYRKKIKTYGNVK